MADNSSNNKRIAKNSVYLYVRTFISIIITLYTSRVFLNQLGVEDFGIYNLVGGVVAMLAVLTNMMANASQRFLSIEIGKKDEKQFAKVFNICVVLHILIFFVFLLVGETLGLWFLSHKLNIPEGKVSITYFVFHFAMIASAVGLLKIPYNALIMAKERMSFYAYISIVEVAAKLIITLLLTVFANKLASYSIMFLIVTILVVCSYYLYCYFKIGLPPFRIIRFRGNPEYKEILSFSGWSFVGNMATVARDQGIGFVLNIFLGVILNAAMGILLQVLNVYSSLYLNLQSAFRPQIIQNHVTDTMRYNRLLCLCTNYSILLMGAVCIPMILVCRQVLTAWLGTVPDYAIGFVQIAMYKIMFSTISQCVSISLDACAKIKTSQITSSILSFGSLVLMYVTLSLCIHPNIVITILALTDFLLLLYKLWYAHRENCCDTHRLIKYCFKTFGVILSMMLVAFYLSTLISSNESAFFALLFFLCMYMVVSATLIEKSQLHIIIYKIKSIAHI